LAVAKSKNPLLYDLAVGNASGQPSTRGAEQRKKVDMKRTVAAFCVIAAAFAATAAAQERDKPKGIPHQDHVFVIVLENHRFHQTTNSPTEPFLNSQIAKGKVSLAKNYFAIGHPSLTNYLEIVGSSNFGVRSDNPPNWGSTTCTPNIQSGIINAD